jgi:hypothetical protein
MGQQSIAKWAIIVTLALLHPSQAQDELSDRVIEATTQQIDELLDCWKNTVATYAVETCEPANAVVNAVFGKCVAQEGKWRDAALAYSLSELRGRQTEEVIRNATQDFTRNILKGMRSSVRPFMLSAILDKRAELGHCKTSGPKSE